MALRPSSSSHSPLSELEGLLTCSVCLEFFTNPKTLPCHHSFCQVCLENLPQETPRSLSCPTCRHRTDLPNGGAAALSAAFYLDKCTEIYSQMKKDVSCDNCGENNATGYCQKCHRSLCTKCIELHNKWSGFSNHKIIDVALTQNLSKIIEQFREVKDALADIIKKEEGVKQEGEGLTAQVSDKVLNRFGSEQLGNIDEILHLLIKERKSLELVLKKYTEAEQLLVSLKDINKSASITTGPSSQQSLYYFGTSVPRADLQQFKVKVDIDSFEFGLLSLSLTIALPASAPHLLIVPLSSIKCRLIPVTKGKEQTEDKYRITTTSVSGVFQVHCSPLASGSHNFIVQLFDVQLEAVSVAVPFNPHFDAIAPRCVIHKLKDPSSVAVVDDGSVIVTEREDWYNGVAYKCHFSKVDIATTSSVTKRIFNVAFACTSFKNNVVIASSSFVQILTPDAETVREMTDPIRLTKPSGLAVSSTTGFIYIADGKCVYILTPELGFIQSFGKEGRGDGEFANAQDITIAIIDGEEFLYIADYNNHRIQKFTVQGQFLSAFGSQGNGPGQLTNPCGITIGTGGLLYVTEIGNHRVSVFTCGGDFVTCFGRKGSNIDQFNNPQGIAFDKNGIMYVCDCGNKRLVLY